MSQTQGKVIQLSNGELAVTLDDDTLAKAGLRVGDKVIWNPAKMGFKKFERFEFSFLLGPSEIQVRCPPDVAAMDGNINFVHITLRLSGNQHHTIITRDEFEMFVNGLGDMNQQLKYISEIISVEG